MVIATITERGIISQKNTIQLIEGTNNKAYNFAQGTILSATYNTATLDEKNDVTGKVIEIIYGSGKNQSRIITDYTSSIATVYPDWDRIPDSTSNYVIHVHSGICPDQLHSQVDCYIDLGAGSSSIDDYYTGSFIKILNGNGKEQITEIIEYYGASKLACVEPRLTIPVLNGSIYAIYGEGGLTAASTSSTITLDGNQSSVIAAGHFIEITSGNGNGQVRKIAALSGNVATIEADWDIIPENTNRYILYGGWAPNSYENVVRYTIITISSDIDSHSGERILIDMESSMTTMGSAEVRSLVELSSKNSIKSHAITVVAQFFRLKIISMGTSINGYIQTIYNSYKSGKVTSKIEEPVGASNDCDLVKSVLVGKSSSGQYKNISIDYFGNMSVNIKNPADAFGSINVTQPRQYAELMFLNDIINPVLLKSELLNGGTISASNNMCIVSTGTNASGKASFYSQKSIRYTPGLGIAVRFTAIFSTPTSTSTQLIGIGDSCDGLFLGYNGTNFGILHRRGGKNEIRRLTITTPSTDNDTITITLNGIITSGISILSTDNIQNISRKIALSISIFSALGDGWDIYEEGSSVLFISRISGPLTGSFSYNVGTSDSAGTFASVQSGIAATNNWIYRYNWNLDKGEGDQNLPYINPQKGNVYEILFQWLGFGYIIFRMENPNTGYFQDIHHIKYPNLNTVVSLQNPNLPLCAFAQKTSGDSTNIMLKTASMGIFIMGDNNKTLGQRLGLTSIYDTTAGGLSAGTYYNILALRNSPSINNTKNKSDVMILNVSFSFNAGSSITKGGIFTIFAGSLLTNTNTITWNKRDSAYSPIEYSKDCYPIIGGSELLSRVCGSQFSFGTSVLDLEISILPGVIIYVVFKPFQELLTTPDASTAIISCGVSWVQR